jgi:medium-chain acyl-[acyl-carrier-protein] hydrolase
MSFYKHHHSWFVHYIGNKANSETKLRVFCFHHSGGTASFFREWHQFLPPGVELMSVQLPGRETSSTQPFITDINIVTKQITDKFHPYQTTPFIFFGHSLGALIAFEVANELHRIQYLKPPKYLIVSGRNAPQTKSREKILHNLPDELFIKGLSKYQGMPDEILQNKELLEILLPRLRADFTLSETYQYKNQQPLECPILALGGKDDPTVNYEELDAWKIQTTKKFATKLFPGGHFFLTSARKEVWNVVSTTIKNVLETL